MPDDCHCSISDFDAHFKVFHELMSIKVLEILLVASPYDAYILEEDGSLASKIMNEYRGLNLSRPPRITWAESARKALGALEGRAYDLVLVMPDLDDMDGVALGRAIKKIRPGLPVILLAHSLQKFGLLNPGGNGMEGIDQVFIWSGDADLLLAIVKSVEDRLNVDFDTDRAMVRVLLLVEDSPLYRSYFLPLIYKAVVQQTQNVLDESLNEVHRLLKMRARPKILVAENYEEAILLFQKYQDYLFGIIADTRFPKAGRESETAGVEFLTITKKEIPDLPVLLLSSESGNRDKAAAIPAAFLDKNSPDLVREINDFFLNFLGFGDFVFRDQKGNEFGRASDLRTLERILVNVPDEPLCYHAVRNRFSNWIMARSEIGLASMLRKVSVSDFADVNAMRRFIIENIHNLRKQRQRGVVAQFSVRDFDPEISDFLKIGQGSLGGKARGLAFMSHLLRQSPEFLNKYSEIDIWVPQTLVISTEGFEFFIRENELDALAFTNLTDDEIKQRFLAARMPDDIQASLRHFIGKVTYPLAVRSSSLLEDVREHPFAGLYKTVMIANNAPMSEIRLTQLITAVKLVYASFFLNEPRTFRDSIAFQRRKESMAVIVQQLTGRTYGDYFYPAISGIAQSQNFYPIGHLKSEYGAACIVLGIGRPVDSGAEGVRFCPRFPNVMPQLSRIEDILENAQRFFYALNLKAFNLSELNGIEAGLEHRRVDMAADEWPVQYLSSAYIGEENRFRDGAHFNGPRVLTFNNILKYNQFPLAQLLSDLLELGRKGTGCPVEFEFSMDLAAHPGLRHQFHVLQVKPMTTGGSRLDISAAEVDCALCYSTQSLGNGECSTIKDILYVKPDQFDPSQTLTIAQEIGRINSELFAQKRTYLIIGPGRWGSFDPLLGIPVKWRDICGAGVIVELFNGRIQADPSHGSHFFHQITSRGLFYLTISEGLSGFINWQRLSRLTCVQQGKYLCHVRLPYFLTVKCDGRRSRCVILDNLA